jgi:Tfp pilus assembly protein FimT
VELVVVGVVLVVLLAAIAPRFNRTTQRLQAERTAFELAQLLRYAHGRAVAQGDVIVAAWDPQQRRVQLGAISGAEREQWPADCEAAAAPLVPARESSPVPAAVTVSLAREDRVVACVNFFPDGTSEPTTLHLLHEAHDYTVTVDGPTSQVVLTTRPLAR